MRSHKSYTCVKIRKPAGSTVLKIYLGAVFGFSIIALIVLVEDALLGRTTESRIYGTWLFVSLVLLWIGRSVQLMRQRPNQTTNLRMN